MGGAGKVKYKIQFTAMHFLYGEVECITYVFPGAYDPEPLSLVLSPWSQPLPE